MFFIGISGSVSFISFIKRQRRFRPCFVFLFIIYILLYMRAKDNLFIFALSPGTRRRNNIQQSGHNAV
nr:MAG TPA: hypothetical protein [Caudoviricetes sp.]